MEIALLAQTNVDEICQKRMDAIAAKRLHEHRLVKLNWLNLFVDWLAIGVPIVYFVIRVLARGTPNEGAVELVWEFLAALLLVLPFTKIAWKTQDRAEDHNKLIGRNISLATQAKQLLDNVQNSSLNEVQLLITLADRLEEDDRQALGEVSERERQWAYRDALKEFTPSSTVLCPKCGADPWKFVPGSCQLCVNTPANTQYSR